MAEKVLTPVGRVAWPHVFKPRKSNKPDEDPKYEITLVFNKSEDLSELKRIAAEAAREEWGAKAETMNLKSPFRDGATRAHLEGFDETVISIRAISTKRVSVVDRDMNVITDPEQLYGGCYARASIHAFTYNREDNKGVSFSLHNVQKSHDGTPMGGRSTPEEDFEKLEAPEGEAAPPAGADDALFK